MIINYVSGPCGSGKSYAFVEQAIENSRSGYPTIITCQTIKLLEQYKTMIGDSANVTCIHHENSRGVIHKIYDSYAEFVATAGIMLITWATYQQLHLTNRDNVHLIVDEIPSVVDPITLNISETHKILTDQATLHFESNVHSLLIVTDRKILTEIFENRKNDTFYATIQNLAGKLLSKHWLVYVNTAQYHKLLSKKKTERPEQIDFFPILKTSVFQGFRSVTIGAANFEHSLLYTMLKNDPRISLKKDLYATNNLRYSQHENGGLIDIYYAVNGDWSQNLMREDKEGLNRVVQAFEGVLKGKSYVWAANNKQVESLFSAGDSNRLPASPHGLNDFQAFHNVASIGAFNFKPATIKFFETKYGIPGERIRIAINYEMNYQIVCRTSIRNPDDRSPKIICIPDENQALWLQTLFPGSRVHSLDVKLEKDLKSTFKAQTPRKPGAVRKKESIVRKKQRQKDRAEELERRYAQARLKLPSPEAGGSVPPHSPSGNELIQNDGNNYDLMDKGPNVTHFFGSIWLNRRSKSAEIAFCCDDFDEIAKFLRNCHKARCANKHDNLLISPTMFDPKDTEISSRARSDALFCGMGWLDNDGGGISEKEFATIFSNIKFIIYDTYSSTRENRRYRVCIPFERPVLPDEYDLIMKEFFDVLKYNGYDFKGENGMKKHGFDKMGSLVTSLLYLPCQSADPKANRFKPYSANRRILDPDDWLENLLCPEPLLQLSESPSLVPDAAPPVLAFGSTIEGLPTEDSATSNEDEIKRAMEIWSFRQKKKGEGHKAFWTLALHLARAGYAETALRETLWKESFNAISVKERQREIDGIFVELRKRGFFKREPAPHSPSP